MPQIYQIWPTSTRFFCGCCITGPSKDLPGMLYIHCCSLGIVIPFCIFVIGQNWAVSPALPILFLVNIVLMYTFLFMTACSNPGIIPRKPFLQLNPQKYLNYLVSPDNSNNARNCYTCQIYRPKRTSHCSSCQNCVQIFDHHCGIVGTCIGKRNYRYFMLFITFVFISMVLFIINMVVFLIGKTTKNVDPTAIIIIISIVAAVIGIPILVFLIFHLYLLITKKTTRQLLKNIKDQDNQYENQWCEIDAPIMDLFTEISEDQARIIKYKLQNMGRSCVPLQQNNPVTEIVQQL